MLYLVHLELFNKFWATTLKESQNGLGNEPKWHLDNLFGCDSFIVSPTGRLGTVMAREEWLNALKGYAVIKNFN